MCTVASRCGLGNIVWLAYDCAAFNAPCQAKATQICCGSNLVAFNSQGACAFHARISDSKPGRADLWLRSELEINAEMLGCSYVTPPIGSYDERVVGCDGSVRCRRARFHETWCREGTCVPAGERRWLSRFMRLPTDDKIRFAADLTLAMQAKETTSHSDPLDLCLEGLALL